MRANRLTLLCASAALTLGAGLSASQPALAQQASGELAQAPLNLATSVPPAFVMAVDDSGSMQFEVMLAAKNGQACWARDSNSQPYSFFYTSGADTGKLRSCNSAPEYFNLFPYSGYNSQYSTARAIPPFDIFGFSRSHNYNPSYFDPNVGYRPWLKADGSSYPQASRTAAKVHPDGLNQTGGTGATATFNLTAVQSDTSNGFQMETEMKIPKGVSYRSGTQWKESDGNKTSTNIEYIQYFPATFYLKNTGDLPAGYGYTATPLAIADAGGRGVTLYRYEIKEGNFASGKYGAAMDNFANWFQYYRNRRLAMVAAASQAFSDVSNMRVGYFTINNRQAVTMFDMGVDKTGLYQAFLKLPASGGTPNLAAVDYIGGQFQRTNSGAPIRLACQKNAGMLFTDGYSNSGSPGAPAVTGLGEPFDPTPKDSMAAIATKYYQTTLRTGTGFPAGQVPVPAGCGVDKPDPRLDCEADLHMNFYGITLGAHGDIFDPNKDRDPFVEPYPDWKGHLDDAPQAVDDIWHATINTRGDFVNAATPADITDAMRRILAAVGEGAGISGSLALTGARVGEDSLTVVPSFEARNNGTDWYSRLSGQEVIIGDDGAVSYAEIWEASTQLPPASGDGGREIFAVTDSAGVTPVVNDFTTTGLGSNALSRLCSDDFARCSSAEITALGVTAEQAIAYLRGDQSLEASGKLRERTTRLGDIINSGPAITSPRDNYGYTALSDPSGNEVDPFDYTGYLKEKSSRIPMAYVGANDGMLHAFRGDTGVESFAYIPGTALGHMGNLLFPNDPTEPSGNQKFQHRYYVDGLVTVSDALVDGDWKTMLVGAAGAGGRSVFGLDVSRPASFAAGDVLWEIHDDIASTTGERIGYVLGKPVIVPVLRGNEVHWKALFGNGYDSESGQAVLFVVDVADGSVASIPVGAANSGNGLGNIIAIDRWIADSKTDRGSDGYADTVYGGDLQGNVWKFDLRDNSAAFAGDPLFTALDAGGNPQPITGGLDAAAGPGGGVMIYFGTGSYSYTNDPDDDSVQTLYGIWDNEADAPITGGRGSLQVQTISSETTEAGQSVRRITTNPINFITEMGWYLDLGVVTSGKIDAVGERFVGIPSLQSGTVFFTTFEPGDSGDCAAGGSNWLYALDALSGAAAMSNVRVGGPDATPLSDGTGAVALQTSGTAPVKDIAVLLPPSPPPLDADSDADEIAAALGRTCDLVVQVAGAPSVYLPRPCGRQSWRQIR